MMRSLPLVALLVACSTAVADPPSGAIEVGAPAPAFTLNDLDGHPVSLADYADQVVVLEWFNPGCPYVKYAHGAGGPLAGAATAAEARGVKWLAINSGAPGKEGHGVEVNRAAAGEWGLTHPILIDESGAVGHAYDARTTPTLYVVDHGTLVYAGAPDNAPLGEVKPAGATHADYLGPTLDAVLAGSRPSPGRTTSYGCSVKYGS